MPFRDEFFHERLLFGKQLLALRNMTALHSSFIFARPIAHFALLCSATIAAFTASAGDRIPPKCRIAKNRRLSLPSMGDNHGMRMEGPAKIGARAASIPIEELNAENEE